MDYPGDLYFFLTSSNINWTMLNTFAAIIFLLILALTYLPWIKVNESSDGISVKTFNAPWFFLLLISVFIIIMRISSLLPGEQNVDESLWISGTATFMQSPHLWTSFDTTTSGPLVMLPLILIKLTGLDLNYASARLAGILFCIIPSVIFCYYTFRILFEEKISRVLTLPLTACFAFMSMRNYIAYNGEYQIIFFSSLAVFFHTKLLTGNSQRNNLLGYGLVLGSLPFTKLQATPIALSLGLCLFIYLIKSKARLISYILIFVGFISPTLLIISWLLVTGGLQDFWLAYFASNLNYGQPGHGINNSSWIHFKYFVYLLRTIPDSKFYFLSLLSISVFTGIFLIIKKRFQKDHFFLLLSSLALIASSYYAIVKTSFFFTHYFLIFLIPVLYLAAIVAWISHDTFKESKTYNRALIILSFLCFATISMDGITRAISYSGTKNSLLQKSVVAETINKFGNKNDKMAVWGWLPSLYVQTGLTNGTRYADCYHQLTKSGMQQYYLDTFLEDLKGNKPLIFVDAITPYSFGINGTEFKHQNFPSINKYVEANYRKVEVSEEIEIYIRKK